MTNLTKKADYAGKTIFIGLDVHSKSWSVSLFTEKIFITSFNQPPAPVILAQSVKEKYPHAHFKCAYEAGYCGFSLQRQLSELGIECIVVNPSDIPQTNKSSTTKNDRNDARRIGEYLQAGLLKPIYIPDRETESHRQLVRFRGQIVRDLKAIKTRIKSLLYLNGIIIPSNFSSGKWTKIYKQWLENLHFDFIYTKQTLQGHIEQIEKLLIQKKQLEQDMTKLMETERYKQHYEALRTVPGIGQIVATTLILEIGQINRFKNFNQFNSYIGFCPSEYSSGEKEHKGKITTRKHSALRSLLIEAAWMAIKKDPALTLKYESLLNRMSGKRAVISIARKLLNRIWRTWNKSDSYVIGVVQ